tara:strand:+ start:471 stop:785 length:315 start_codon:yes stop_codon:yes gene_type:complete
MSHFNENKTNLEILLEEKMKEEIEILYNQELEIEADEFVEISIEKEGLKNADRVFTREELSAEYRRWLSSRPKLLFSLFKQRRFKAIRKELCAIWERLRQEYRS